MTEPNANLVTEVIEHEDGNDSRDRLAEIGLEFVIYCAAAGIDMQDAFHRILSPLEEKCD